MPVSDCGLMKTEANRWLLREKGPHALKRTFQTGIHHKNRTAKEIENLVITFSLKNTDLGQPSISPTANSAPDRNQPHRRQVCLAKRENKHQRFKATTCNSLITFWCIDMMN